MAFLDLDSLKNDTAREKAVREKLAEVIYNALLAEFGKENVLFIPKAIYPAGGSKINSLSIAVKVADVTDRDGFTVDAVGIVSPMAKPWNTVLAKNRKNPTPAITLDDIRDELENGE